jgi:hypothetical protein
VKKLIERFGRAVKGVLTGFDRIVFKGSIRPLAYAEGAMEFLRGRGVLNRDYKRWMLGQSEALVEAIEGRAREQRGKGITHFNSWREDKEALARARQKAEGIDSGLIGAWSFLESGRSYRACYDAQAGYPQLRPRTPSCRHVYLYFDHEDYGWMNIRIQTWFPYPIQICLNGREWLRRSLQKRGIEFVAHGNKFLDLADWAQAQRLLEEQLDRRWPWLLDRLLPLGFPTMRQTLGPHLRYYWTLWQSEWATDIVMDSPAVLDPLMETLVRHAFLTGTSTRVLRYMGRPLTAAGQPDARSNHEVYSRLMHFHEGVRVRHWVDRNSIKVYNEFNNLRIEMTMNRPGMFRVYRHAQGQRRSAKKRLRPLRKGVADIPLRTQVAQEVNNRFMESLAEFSQPTRVRDLLDPLTRSKAKRGRRVRALEPTGKDRALFEALSDPADALAGISNRALRDRLRHTPWGAGRTDAQLSARISRHLRLLRNHGLLRKIPKRRRYHLTPQGRQFVTALRAMLAASTQQLMQAAA